jgi:uncharacterized protein YdeI (YjbR/CyaY-like superfamily)
LTPTFFATPADLRHWFEKNHDREKELLVGFYKVGSDKPSITWPESVDQALCFGWIDGIRKTLDQESYCIRFTPRKPKSIWSAVNINKVAALQQQGLMQPAGLACFEKRTEDRSAIYAYEKAPVQLAAGYEQQFRENARAWDFFQQQAPSYRQVAMNWVMTAKQEKTRLSRLQTLIAGSAAGRKV